MHAVMRHVKSKQDSIPTITWQFNSLSANFTKWSNTLKEFVVKLPTNCLSMFDNFEGLELKGLICLV